MSDELKAEIARLLAENGELRAENERLDALFQTTHGVHVSWVDEVINLRERVAELESGLKDPHRVHASIVRGDIALTREQALHIACASDFDETVTRRAVAEQRLAEAAKLRERVADAEHDSVRLHGISLRPLPRRAERRAVMLSPDCTEACTAMPECSVCGVSKHPRGRDPGVYASSGYCNSDCPGYGEEPRPGHLWPSEWREHLESLARPGAGETK